MATIADRNYGACGKCKQKLLLNQDGLCVHCELDSLREQLDWKDVELSKYRKKNSELSEKLNGVYAQLHTILANRKA